MTSSGCAPPIRNGAGGPDRTGTVAAALVVVAAVAAATFKIADSDLFWHLRNGYETLRTGRIASTDVFSYTARGEYYAYYSWLWEVLAALVHRAGGFAGLVAVKAIWYGGVFGALAWTSRARGGRGLAVGWALLYALVLVRHRMYVRPEMATLGLIPVFDGLARRFLDRGSFRTLYALPPLALLWANLHPYVIAGIGLLAAHAAGAAVDERLGRMSRPGKPAHLAGAAAAAFAATLVNPFGPFIYTPAYRLVFAEAIARAPTREWLPPGWDGYASFFVLAAAAALLLALTARGLPAADGLVFAGALALAAAARRNVGLFAVLSAPIVARSLTEISRRAGPAARRFAPNLARLAAGPGGVAAMALAAGWVSVRLLSPHASWVHLDQSRLYEPGLGMGRTSAPRACVEFIEAKRLEGPLYNSWALGGYLIWRSWPRLSVMVDGRQMVYERFLAWAQRKTTDALLDELGVRFALVSYDDAAFAATLARRPDFSLVFFDDVAMVYVRDPGRDAGRLEPYRWLRPHDTTLGWLPHDPEALRGALAEARRAAAAAPGSARAAMILGAVAARAGRGEEALAAYRRAVALDRAQASYRNNLGRLLLERGEWSSALDLFLAAAARDPREPIYRFNAALALAAGGKNRAARRHLRRALALDPGPGLERRIEGLLDELAEGR
ncbi:MAG: hypothetical protein D6718_09480 [Acidobacteria bacterium]|nr:MAG: hypothetical protein D6718_09480 [Acidobacteriota bacterium]